MLRWSSAAHLDSPCPKSPTSKHELGPIEFCAGTMNHADPGGWRYAHRSRECKWCYKSFCDFSNATPLKGEAAGGWY